VLGCGVGPDVEVDLYELRHWTPRCWSRTGTHMPNKVWAADSPGLPVPSESAAASLDREQVASTAPAGGAGAAHETQNSAAWPAPHARTTDRASSDIGEEGAGAEHHSASSRTEADPSIISRRTTGNFERLSVVVGARAGPSMQTRTVIWNFLESPQSKLARLWSATMLALIILSCGAFVLETHVPLCCGRYDTTWGGIEQVCIVFFTLEYLLRFCACPVTFGAQEHTPAFKRAMYAENYLIAHPEQKWNPVIAKELLKSRLRFMYGPLNLIDIVAILPYYIELILTASGGEMDLGLMRIVRLVRVFRLLKLGKYNDGLQLLAQTMSQSMQALGMLCFVLGIVLIICSAILYFVEKGAWCDASNNFCNRHVPAQEQGVLGGGPGWYYNRGDHAEAVYSDGCSEPYCLVKSKFQSIPVSMYWAMAAITTTGYGDIVPQTWLGKFFACCIMFLGLLLLALPITVISGNFATIYASQELIKFQQNEEEKSCVPTSTKEHLEHDMNTVNSSHLESGAKFGWVHSEEGEMGFDHAQAAGGEECGLNYFDEQATTEYQRRPSYSPDQWGDLHSRYSRGPKSVSRCPCDVGGATSCLSDSGGARGGFAGGQYVRVVGCRFGAGGQPKVAAADVGGDLTHPPPTGYFEFFFMIQRHLSR